MKKVANKCIKLSQVCRRRRRIDFTNLITYGQIQEIPRPSLSKEQLMS